MSILRKIFAAFISIILMATITALLFFRQEIYQLYKVLTFFDEDVISENFRSIDKIFKTSVVPKPASSYAFPVREVPTMLPETFTFNDSIFNMQAYLDYSCTDALIILRNDTIYHEYYANHFTADDHHISWSMSKSVISALFGIAVHEGKIRSIEETVTDYLPEFVGTGYDGVRIKDVLQMSSGVGFNEDYGNFNSDINVMGRYFALGMPMAKFARRLKRANEPGTFNHYVSIDTQVLGMILTKATGESIRDYMYEKLWAPIGASAKAYWIVDKSGMEFVLGGLNVTARDYAKLGQLYLDSGRWRGKQLVPEEWVLASITPDAPHLMPGIRKTALRKDGYGYQWWIPYGSEDEFNAQGIYGQFIYADPDKNMVIVKLSSNYHFKKDKTGFFHDVEVALFRKIVEVLSII